MYEALHNLGFKSIDLGKAVEMVHQHVKDINKNIVKRFLEIAQPKNNKIHSFQRELLKSMKTVEAN